MLKSNLYVENQNVKSAGSVTSLILFGTTGFIIANTMFLGGISPLNVSLISCTSFLSSLAVFISSLISYIFNGKAIDALPQIISMLVVIIVKFVVVEIANKKQSKTMFSIISGVLMLFVSVGISFLKNATNQEYVLNFANSLICGSSTFFLFSIKNAIEKDKVIPVSGVGGASLGVIYTFAIATLASIDIFSLNIGLILGILVILLAIKKYKYLGGAICGVLTSCGIMMCSPTIGLGTIFFALSGIIAGICLNSGVVGSTFVFMIINIIGLATTGITTETFFIVINLAVSTSIYVIIPVSLWLKVIRIFGTYSSSLNIISQNAVGKLQFAAMTIKDMNNSFEQVSDVIEQNSNLVEIMSEKKLHKKEMRDMLSEHFIAVEDMLNSLTTNMCRCSLIDDYYSKKIDTYFSKFGIYKTHSCVYLNKYGYINIEIFIENSIEMDSDDLLIDISDIVERELDTPKFFKIDNITRIEMWEKPTYSVDIGAYQISGKETETSGDCYEYFYNQNSEMYIVLSDGMGSGKRAKLDALLTSSFISRLIQAGVGYKAAIKFVNNYLKAKSWEESFATVDISMINLYTGKLEVIKAGAWATYIIRNGKAIKIEMCSFPIGIIDSVNPVLKEYNLNDNDIVVCVSDGVHDECLKDFVTISRENKSKTTQEIAKMMARKAHNTSSDEHVDDITVIVAKVKI